MSELKEFQTDLQKMIDERNICIPNNGSEIVPKYLRKNRIPGTKMGIFEHGRPFKLLKDSTINTYLDIYDWFNPEPSNDDCKKEHDYVVSIVPNYCPNYFGKYCGRRGCSMYK